jgi:hypothetical protein
VRGNEAKARKADARAADLLPVIEDIRAEGRTSLRQIALGLTERPAWGRDWTGQRSRIWWRESEKAASGLNLRSKAPKILADRGLFL